jgi:hypothetical protein
LIGLAEPNPHLLAEPAQRCAQKKNSGEEQYGGAIHVLKAEEGTAKAHGKQQCRAYPAGLCETCGVVQQIGPSPQPRKIRLEVGTRWLIIGNVLQRVNIARRNTTSLR